MFALFLSLEVSGILLNGAFLVVVWARSNVSTRVKYYLTNLALANVVIDVSGIMIDLNLFWYSEPGRGICIAQVLVIPTCVYTTLGSVVAMGIERIVAIRFPLKYQQVFSLKCTRLVAGSVILTSAVLNLVRLPDYLATEAGSCLPLDPYPKNYATLLMAGVLSILLTMTWVVLIVLVRTFLRYLKSRPQSHQAANPDNKLILAAKLAIASGVFYGVTCMPSIAYFLWIQYSDCDNLCIKTDGFSMVATAILIVFTFGDPIIYFAGIIGCRSVCCRRTDVSERVHPQTGLNDGEIGVNTIGSQMIYPGKNPAKASPL